MNGSSIVRPGRFALLGLVLAIVGLASARAPRPFVVPRDRAASDARREGLRREVDRALEAGLPARPAAPGLEVRGRESRPGLIVERIAIDPGTTATGTIEGFLTMPDGAGPSRREPVVLLVGAPSASAREAVDGHGLDGRPPAVAMAKFGFASLAIDVSPAGSTHLRDLRMTLDALLARPEIDTSRIGVIGLGPAGPAALALMAVDERVGCGVSAIEARDFRDLDALFGGGPSPRLGSFDPSTFADLLAALCAPRPLAFSYCERLPLPNPSAGRRLEGSVRRLFKLYGPEGDGLASSIFGEFDGHELDRCSDTLPGPPIRGYIGLQNHGAPAEYRNIRLQKLGD